MDNSDCRVAHKPHRAPLRWILAVKFHTKRRGTAEYLAFVLGETYREDFYLGNVNRIDITFDVRRVPIEDFWVEDNRVGMKSALIFGKSKNLETIYSGYKSRREFYAYDKKAEIEGRGGLCLAKFRGSGLSIDM